MIVNFRMSPDERKALEERIYLSGLKKQDYMIRSTLYQKIVVVDNQKMFEKFIGELEQIHEKLRKIHDNSEIKIDMLVLLRNVCEIVEELGYSPSTSNLSGD